MQVLLSRRILTQLIVGRFKNALIRELKEPNNELESARLALLADLIAIGTLDIKVGL